MKYLTMDSGIYFEIRAERERYHPTAKKPEGPWRSFFDEKTKNNFVHRASSGISVWTLPEEAILEDSTSESEPEIPPAQDASMEQWPTKQIYSQLGVSKSATLQ